MTASPRQDATPLHEGLVLQDWPTVVTAARQRRYHAAADVDGALFGDQVDLSVLANDTILATRYLKTEAVDGLHAGQRMRQSEPVHLDEALTLKGRIGAVRPTPRGSFVTFAFDFVRADGGVPLRGELLSFRVDAAAARERDAAAAATPGEADDAVLLARKPLTPDRVAAYSHEFPDYLVHFDPAAAASVGLRAPVAQGLMSFTWMMEVLARRGLPPRLDIEASFRRPIFWDDEVRILARGDRELLVATAQGGVCSTAVLHTAAG